LRLPSARGPLSVVYALLLRPALSPGIQLHLLMRTRRMVHANGGLHTLNIFCGCNYVTTRRHKQQSLARCCITFLNMPCFARGIFTRMHYLFCTWGHCMTTTSSPYLAAPGARHPRAFFLAVGTVLTNAVRLLAETTPLARQHTYTTAPLPHAPRVLLAYRRAGTAIAYILLSLCDTLSAALLR